MRGDSGLHPTRLVGHRRDLRLRTPASGPDVQYSVLEPHYITQDYITSTHVLPFEQRFGQENKFIGYLEFVSVVPYFVPRPYQRSPADLICTSDFSGLKANMHRNKTV